MGNYIFSANFLGCDDNLSGPNGAELNYESQVLALGQQFDFGTIGKDFIRVKFAAIGSNSYNILHSGNILEECPKDAKDYWLNLMMWDEIYQVNFLYSTKSDQSIILQL